MSEKLGPWKVTAGEFSEDGKEVAYSMRMPHPEISARHKNLIEAAPDLLEALEAVEDSFFILGLHVDEDDCEGCRLRVKARAAIAKARGE